MLTANPECIFYYANVPSEFHRDSNPEVMLLGRLLKFDRLLFYRVHVHCSVILNWFNKLLLKALLISVFEENAN